MLRLSACFVCLAGLTLAVSASAQTAKSVSSHGYAGAIELRRGDGRAVLCPEAGGRVLEFSLAGQDAMWFDPEETKREGSRGRDSAGRFDFGPELTTPAHPLLWSGKWSTKITGDAAVRLTSERDEASGVQLVRDFELREVAAGSTSTAPLLVCKQTIVNISTQPREYCHWGRSFSPGGGICLIPLAGQSRFSSKYAMYEESAIINVRPSDDKIRERDGFLEILAPPRKPKLGFDSQAGWLAYAMPSGLLFVKRFAVSPDRVYSEAASLTISVWYPPGPRIELEPIGPRERLAPGRSASFTEEWLILQHPYPKDGESLDLAAIKRKVAELGR
jgi:hypothetical protein